VKKAKTPSFVLTLPLVTKGRDVAVMRKRFEAGKRLYNAVLAEGLKRLKFMRNDTRWAALRTVEDVDTKRAGYRMLRQEYRFSEYELSSFATDLKNRLWRDHLGAHEPQLLAKRMFAALEQYSFKKRGKPRFKGRKRPLRSLEGKSAASAIRYQPETGCVRWAGLIMPVLIPTEGRDKYLDEALQKPVKFARVVWKKLGSKTRFFVHLIVEGTPPNHRKTTPGIGGLDIGPSTVASFSDVSATLRKFCPGVVPCATTKRRLQRQADRILRQANPECFDDAGQWIKGKRAEFISNRLQKLRDKIANTDRKLQARRKSEHGQLVNQLLTEANVWQLEKLSYKAFQKMYGKSVSYRAPGAFVQLLKRKAESAGGKVVELNTWKLKMSQYDHCTETYTKKPLSLRWHTLGDGSGEIQRDVYSALLACCTDGKLHKRSSIKLRLAAHEHVLRRTGLWRASESASAGALASAPA
jgi:transposase